jgi:carbonic anhydrase/acetyltransferase-like protein (isoleucine patch superfamily)
MTKHSFLALWILGLALSASCSDPPTSEGDSGELQAITSELTAQTCWDEEYQPESLIVHANGGGRKSTRAEVSETAFIGPDAVVCNLAKVLGTARVEGRASVTGRAVVRDAPRIEGSAVVGGGTDTGSGRVVFDAPVVSGNAVISGQSWIVGTAQVGESARIGNHVTVEGNARVDGNASLEGERLNVGDEAHVTGNARFATGYGAFVWGAALVTDETVVSGSPNIGGTAHIRGRSVISGTAIVRDAAQIIDGTVDGTGKVQGDAVLAAGEHCGDGCVRDTIYDQIVYFGALEVRAGALKTASGALPRVGDKVALRLFLPELASFVCGPYCAALKARVFVRFDGGAFRELPVTAEGHYFARGPTVDWDREGVFDAALTIPGGADRLESYVSFQRIAYGGCYTAYDVPECPTTSSISDDYVSNYGKNFRIAVR